MMASSMFGAKQRISKPLSALAVRTAHIHMVENLYGCSIGTKSPYKYTEDLSRGEQMQMDIYKIPHTR